MKPRSLSFDPRGAAFAAAALAALAGLLGGPSGSALPAPAGDPGSLAFNARYLVVIPAAGVPAYLRAGR